MAVATYKNINAAMLVAIPNPSRQSYEISMQIPECTFLGAQQQPDFAELDIVFYPADKIIELKSLKQYFYQLRNIVVSYERLLNVVFDQLWSTYHPERLRIVMLCRPRGGISSRLTIDSAWRPTPEPGSHKTYQAAPVSTGVSGSALRNSVKV